MLSILVCISKKTKNVLRNSIIRNHISCTRARILTFNPCYPPLKRPSCTEQRVDLNDFPYDGEIINHLQPAFIIPLYLAAVGAYRLRST